MRRCNIAPPSSRSAGNDGERTVREPGADQLLVGRLPGVAIGERLDHRVAAMGDREPKDVEALYQQKNDPEVASMLGGFNTGYARADLAQWVELHRNLRSQRDPAAENPHHAFLDVAVVTDEPGGCLDGERAGERVGRHGADGGLSTPASAACS